jgi:hypothetical protein
MGERLASLPMLTAEELDELRLALEARVKRLASQADEPGPHVRASHYVRCVSLLTAVMEASYTTELEDPVG